MEPTAWNLPIRLVPRRGHQLGMLLFFVVFLGFSLLWMAAAAGFFDLDNGTFNWPHPKDRLSSLFPLFGLPFAALGITGMIGAILKMQPGSPHFHIQIHGDGLLIKSLFKLKRHEWSTLPPFETLRVERRNKHGKRISFYTVANGAPAEGKQGEVLRILADEYGAKNGEEDANALTAWFNELRDLARQGRLDANASVTVPEPFRATAIAIDAAKAAVPGARSAPVIQQPGRPERPPTVQRR